MGTTSFNEMPKFEFYYGKFNCRQCRNRWTSHKVLCIGPSSEPSFMNQKCQNCKKEYAPYEIQKREGRRPITPSDKRHKREFCMGCIRFGSCSEINSGNESESESEDENNSDTDSDNDSVIESDSDCENESESESESETESDSETDNESGSESESDYSENDHYSYY